MEFIALQALTFPYGTPPTGGRSTAMRGFVAILALFIAHVPVGALAQDDRLTRLYEQDRRLALVAERMLTANAPLCRDQMPITGLILHSRDQYGNDVAEGAFAGAPLAISAVLPGSPAAAAGVRVNDSIMAIGDARTGDLVPDEGQPLRDAGFARLAEEGGAPVRLTIQRDGGEFAVRFDAPAGCRALVEVLADDGNKALSDGRVIQVSYGLAARASDAELAVIFAHEMGHLVLEHRRRLEAEGVRKGLLGEFGKNQRLNREVEVEADRVSVHLLVNAGYDPHLAPAFWRSPLGRSVAGGLLRMSATYPLAGARAGLLEREIEDYLGDPAGFSWPGHLLSRRQDRLVPGPR